MVTRLSAKWQPQVKMTGPNLAPLSDLEGAGALFETPQPLRFVASRLESGRVLQVPNENRPVQTRSEKLH